MSPRRSTGGAEGTESMANSLLHRIRNMWQFANLCQWIYLFGKAVKIDESIDVEACSRCQLISIGRGANS